MLLIIIFFPLEKVHTAQQQQIFKSSNPNTAQIINFCFLKFLFHCFINNSALCSFSLESFKYESLRLQSYMLRLFKPHRRQLVLFKPHHRQLVLFKPHHRQLVLFKPHHRQLVLVVVLLDTCSVSLFLNIQNSLCCTIHSIIASVL